MAGEVATWGAHRSTADESSLTLKTPTNSAVFALRAPGGSCAARNHILQGEQQR